MLIACEWLLFVLSLLKHTLTYVSVHKGVTGISHSQMRAYLHQYLGILTLKVLVTTIDALRHF